MSAEEDDLKRIRMEKMRKIMEMQKLVEEKKNQTKLTTADKIDMLLQEILTPSAQQYLNYIKSNNMSLYNQIRTNLFPPEVLGEIDILIQYLQTGRIRRGVYDDIFIKQLERQILGIKSKISIKRGKESKDIGSFLKDE